MEVFGRPPQAVWVRFTGVPIHVWREGVFELLNDCLGKSVEADPKTSKLEEIMFGRVKVPKGSTRELSKEISL